MTKTVTSIRHAEAVPIINWEKSPLATMQKRFRKVIEAILSVDNEPCYIEDLFKCDSGNRNLGYRKAREHIIQLNQNSRNGSGHGLGPFGRNCGDQKCVHDGKPHVVCTSKWSPRGGKIHQYALSKDFYKEMLMSCLASRPKDNCDSEDDGYYHDMDELRDYWISVGEIDP